MRNYIIVLCIFIITLGMLIVIGCSDSGNGNNGDNNGPDTTAVPDTTQPDSTGIGTITPLGEISIGASPAFIQRHEDILLLSTTLGTYAIKIYSLSDPQNPQLVSTHNFSGQITAFDAAEDIVFALVGDKIIALDISNPAAPEEAGELELAAQGRCIAAGNNFVFVGYGEGGGIPDGQAINVSQPASMTVVADMPVSFRYCDYFYNILYCAQGTTPWAIYAIDVENIEQSNIIASVVSEGRNLDISATPWRFLYAAEGSPTGMTEGIFAAYDARTLETFCDDTVSNYGAKKVDFQDNFVYVLFEADAGENHLLQPYFIYHIEHEPVSLPSIIVSGASDVTAGDGYIYVAAKDGTGKIMVYKHEY